MDHLTRKLPTVRQLQCFLAVAEELNYRQAAERLAMSQPPLTRHIQALEETLGCTLFMRDTHRVHLTAEGAALRGKAAALLSELAGWVADSHTAPPVLRIGLTATLNFSAIPQIATRLQAITGSSDIEIQNQTTGPLLQALIREQMDIVIVGEKRDDADQNVRFHWICREPLCVVMPAAHPASQQVNVSLADLAGLPLFWFARRANPAFYDKCERYLSGLPFPLKRLREPNDSLVLLGSIARGKGFALLPRSMCTFRQHGLCFRPLSERDNAALNIDVYAVSRQQEHRQQVMKAIQHLTAPPEAEAEAEAEAGMGQPAGWQGKEN